MKLNCDIIMDLLPLYCQGATSEPTNRLLCEHMRCCADCGKRRDAVLADFVNRQTEQSAASSETAKAFQKEFVKRRWKNRLVKIIALLISLACWIAFFTNYFAVGMGKGKGSEAALFINQASAACSDIDISIQAIENDPADSNQVAYNLSRLATACVRLDGLFAGASRYFDAFALYDQERGAFRQLRLFVYVSHQTQGIDADAQLSERELALLRGVREDIQEIVYLPDGEFRANRSSRDLREFERIVSPFLQKYQGDWGVS